MSNPMTPQTPGYPITPGHIDGHRHFCDAFGNYETEISAAWIVRFLQERGRGWETFTYAEIDARYRQRFPREHFSFNGLLPRLIECAGDMYGRADEIQSNTYTVTHRFVAACFKASPADEAAAARLGTAMHKSVHRVAREFAKEGNADV